MIDVLEKLLFKFLSWDSITELSLNLVLALEASFGNLGEVGLDIGVGPLTFRLF